MESWIEGPWMCKPNNKVSLGKPCLALETLGTRRQPCNEPTDRPAAGAVPALRVQGQGRSSFTEKQVLLLATLRSDPLMGVTPKAALGQKATCEGGDHIYIAHRSRLALGLALQPFSP